MTDVKNRILVALDYDFTVNEVVQQEGLFTEFFDDIKRVHPTYRLVERFEKGKSGEVVPVWGEPIELKHPLDYFKVTDEQYKTPKGMGWMQQLLMDKEVVFHGKVTREKFSEIGKQQVMSPGIPEGLWDLKSRHKKMGIEVSFAIISVGLREIIEASPINEVRDGERLIDTIYSGEFYYDDQGRMTNLAYCPSSFDKTKGLMQIVKGSPDLLDRLVPRSKYRFDYRNVIVVGDGFSDISYFSYTRQEGGTPVAVYRLNDEEEYQNALRAVGERVDLIVPREYTPGSRTIHEFDRIIKRMAERKCNFSQSLLHEYRRQRITDEPTLKHIQHHLDKCNECDGAYSIRIIRPS